MTEPQLHLTWPRGDMLLGVHDKVSILLEIRVDGGAPQIIEASAFEVVAIERSERMGINGMRVRIRFVEEEK